MQFLPREVRQGQLGQTAPDIKELGNTPTGLLGGEGTEVSHDKKSVL